MLKLQKWQLFSGGMVALFSLALTRAEIVKSECPVGGEQACFPYPMYLPYESRQALDFHWPALVPAIVLGQIPDSISVDYEKVKRLQWPRIAITILGVTGMWCAIGMWGERLRRGRRLPDENKRGRRGLAMCAGVVGPFSLFAVYLGMRGGFEGPTMTNAGVLMPFVLTVMALIELRILPDSLRNRFVRIGCGAVFVILYAWADSAYVDHLAPPIDREWPKASRRLSPEIVEGMAVHGPGALAGELPGLLLTASSRAGLPWKTFRYGCVWLYWIGILSILASTFPTDHRAYRSARPWVRGAFITISLLALFSWILVPPTYEPTPSFGVFVGALIPVYAMRPRHRGVLA